MPTLKTAVRPRLTMPAVLGAAVYAMVVAFLNLLTGVYTWLAFARPRMFPFDNIVFGYIACLLAALTALLTVFPVAKRWLGIWFLGPPAVLFLVALGRLVYIFANRT
ncbi:hypothetical protein [Streptomyces sp. NPDC001480]|uniref:hypothetical protein n=1 Tax=Streptomyces sp. NPDC001480 TaxID=3364577 RepID=UPI003674CC9B